MCDPYGEIMEKIEVTEEMRSRVLAQVRKAVLQPGAGRARFPSLRRCAALAACLAVALAGLLAGPAVLQKLQTQQPAQVTNGISECATLGALCKAVGFPVSDLINLPFAVEKTTYVSLWGETAEINYTGANGECAVYRKSAGKEDNSGDYGSYAAVREITVGTATVMLKGSGESYTLAIWADGTYAYSLNLSAGLPESGWSAILKEVS